MAVTRRALAGRDGVEFVDNFATLAGPGGGYVDAMRDSDGQEVLVREPDGVHPSPAGADRLADTAIAEMVAAWHLDLVPASTPRHDDGPTRHDRHPVVRPRRRAIDLAPAGSLR